MNFERNRIVKNYPSDAAEGMSVREFTHSLPQSEGEGSPDFDELNIHQQNEPVFIQPPFVHLKIFFRPSV